MKSTLLKQALGLLVASTIATATASAQAHSDHGNDGHGSGAFQQSQAYSQQVNSRQRQQRNRIQAGMHAGRLSRAEFRELMHEQRRISAMEHSFQSDGYIDAWEFRRLERALNIASRNIRAEKHDRQARLAYGYTPRFN
jgi:Spy/CpxP family protein refolding chaperone